VDAYVSIPPIAHANCQHNCTRIQKELLDKGRSRCMPDERKMRREGVSWMQYNILMASDHDIMIHGYLSINLSE